MQREEILRRRIKACTGILILGLVISGATAIPLVSEVEWLVKVTSANDVAGSGKSLSPAWAAWPLNVQAALQSVARDRAFLFYGTDWLAFGHFAIALAFVGALRDPVRNIWLFTFGMIACALVVPYAFVFGAVRGIPVWWRLIDCSFGVVGIIPLWLCRTWSKSLELRPNETH